MSIDHHKNIPYLSYNYPGPVYLIRKLFIMKKKNLQQWVGLIVTISIIFSCNAGEKKVSNPAVKDTTVIEKTEVQTSSWTTNTELILGTIRASLKIDGVQVNVDSGKITIRPKSDFSAIEINSSRGTLMLKPGWHGSGEYEKVFADWSDVGEGMAIRYSADYKAPGNMKVTEWANGKVSGSFSVVVVENNALEKPKQKMLEGEFHFLHDR